MPLLKLVKSKADFAKKTEEYYNAIRTNIQFSGANFKVIAVSSVQPGEGKSTTTVGLGDALNRIGKKTMIALREPSLGPVFGLKRWCCRWWICTGCSYGRYQPSLYRRYARHHNSKQSDQCLFR